MLFQTIYEISEYFYIPYQTFCTFQQVADYNWHTYTNEAHQTLFFFFFSVNSLAHQFVNKMTETATAKFLPHSVIEFFSPPCNGFIYPFFSPTYFFLLSMFSLGFLSFLPFQYVSFLNDLLNPAAVYSIQGEK